MRCMDRIALEKMLGDGLSLEAIGRQVGRHESTVAYWVRKYGLRAANWERHVARGGLQRSELEALIAEGKSIAEIAEVVGRGKATVRHWLRQFGLSTHWAERLGTPVCTPRAHDVSTPGNWRVSLRQMPIGGCRQAPPQGQEGARARGWRRLQPVRVFDQHAGAALPPLGTRGEAARTELEGSGPIH